MVHKRPEACGLALVRHVAWLEKVWPEGPKEALVFGMGLVWSVKKPEPDLACGQPQANLHLCTAQQ